MKQGLIDSHAHYENGRFKADRDVLISSMPGLGVDYIVNVGCDLPSSIEAIEIAEMHEKVYANVGVHPHEAKTLDDTMLDKLLQMCNHPKVVGYGEIGLDFYYDFSPRDVQRQWFTRQLHAACEIDMPVIIHARDADQEVFDTIKASPLKNGVVHCFSGDAELAMRYVDMGLYIGVGGVVTYDKTGRLQDVVAAIPLEHILLETDAPYMAPHPKRGKRNESHYLHYVAAEIAKIKNTTAEEVCRVTSENVFKLFPKMSA